MAFDVWPATVPTRMIPGTYREKMERFVDTFQPEQGPPIEGVSGSVANDIVTWEQFLTHNEWTALKTFYRTTLNHGTEYFTLTNPQSGSSETFQFTAEPEAADIAAQVHAQTSDLKRLLTYRVSIALRRFN